MRVLVTGATGYVGRHVVRALVDAGHEVSALARGTRGPIPGVRFVRGDVTDPASVTAAMRDVEACVHLVAVIVERGAQTFERVNARGTENVVRALEDAGVARLVHLSALGASEDERFPYLASKWRGEQAVRASGLDWTILRPSVLHGEGAGFFRPIVWTLRWMPVYPLPDGGQTRFQPLWIADLGRCVVRALDGSASKETVEIGGPEIMTFAELVSLTMEVLGKRRRTLAVPVWTARPFALVQQLRREPLVTNQQLDMVVLDNTTALDAVPLAFGFEPRRIRETDLRWLARL
jgi:NADH dehydrogenase